MPWPVLDPNPSAGGLVIIDTETEPNGRLRINGAVGYYRPRSWADEELGIVRLHWEHASKSAA